MRLSIQVFVVVAAVLLLAGSVFADKDQPEFANTRADVNETEPLNNTCPGEPYNLGDVYHATLNPPGDHDWISFYCNEGDLITVGTDSEAGSNTDTWIGMMADDCSTVLAFDGDSGPSLFSLICNFPAPYTGTYNVMVEGEMATGAYILIATCTPPPDTVCPIDTYKQFKFDQIATIPNGLPAGINYGPIVIADDDTTILDVVVDVGISHTHVGDLVVTLTHIPLVGPSQSVDLIQRPGVDKFGCAGDLVGNQIDKYYFGTGNLTPLASCCSETIPLQCYGVAPEDPNGLPLFRDKPKAGEWFLHVADFDIAHGDGTLYNFSVHFLNDPPVNVDASSWGTIKANYR